MPKRTNCSTDRSDYCAGREYEGLGFNNRRIQGEFVHNMDYSTTPPKGQGRAFYVETTQVTPGRKKRRMGGFD